MKRPRVVVRGVGLVTSLGSNTTLSWENLIAGRTGIRPLSQFDARGYRTQIAGEAVWPSHGNGMDRCHALALAAAKQAVADADLTSSREVDPRRIGVFVGTSLGGMLAGQAYYRSRARKGYLRPWLLHRYPFHRCLDVLVEQFGFLGPCSVASTACTASTIALCQAYQAIISGDADVALAGGVDPLTELAFAGFNAMQNVSAEPCAPFSSPEGLSLGEGAGFVVLERLDEPRTSERPAYAEILGYQLNADAHHPTAPDPTGNSQRALLTGALRDADTDPVQVQFVNAHGTGTGTNDAIESRALSAVFGDRAATLKVASIKGATGHTLGAAGAIEFVATVLALWHQTVPPTTNFKEPRRWCTLDYVPNRGRPEVLTHAVTQNFAFGGNNAALVLCRPDQGAEPVGRESRAKAPEGVVVTGLAPISCAAIGRNEMAEAMLASTGGLLSAASPDLPGPSGAVTKFDPAQLTRASIRRADRLGKFTIAGVDLALSDAGLRVTKENSPRIGLVLGTAYGPIQSCCDFFHPVSEGAPQHADPGIFPNTVYNAAAGLAAANFRLRGCNVTTTVGQASGLQAIAYGVQLLRDNRLDAVIAGGVEELPPILLEAFRRTRLASPWVGDRNGQVGACAFDRQANGFVLGEGAGFVLLERESHARRRGANARARVDGYGVCSDRLQKGVRSGGGEAVHWAMSRALDHAPSDPPDAIFAAGLSHPRLDAAEAHGIMSLFGADAPPVVVVGDAVGASGATSGLSFIAAVLALESCILPAMSNCSEAAYPLDVVTTQARRRPLQRAVVNALSLGGVTVSLAVSRTDAETPFNA